MFGHTTVTKTAEVEKKWVVIDAKGLVRDKFIDVREQLVFDVVLPLLPL